ncbi:hypothetical protein [Microvirga massiliensis]|uniref:hypothetical protein n=1 Tax=Microvirga massiliensis TaxID=1033741 RepID=UPI00069AC2E5|nr:hypothetical protein [Microvirga massiliensis]
MIDAGSDAIFTMLNAGRTGAIDACRERNVPQIGNIGDWVATMPDVSIASAVADSGRALFNAAEDLVKGSFKPGMTKQIGLEQPEAVRLTVSDRIPPDVRSQISALAADIVAERIHVSTEWAGDEFETAKTSKSATGPPGHDLPFGLAACRRNTRAVFGGWNRPSCSAAYC